MTRVFTGWDDLPGTKAGVTSTRYVISCGVPFEMCSRAMGLSCPGLDPFSEAVVNLAVGSLSSTTNLARYVGVPDKFSFRSKIVTENLRPMNSV